VPLDPFLGKPFQYEVKDGTAKLYGPLPPGQPTQARNIVNYELTMRK
jgi:hypothetical protein